MDTSALKGKLMLTVLGGIAQFNPTGPSHDPIADTPNRARRRTAASGEGGCELGWHKTIPDHANDFVEEQAAF